MTSDGVSSDLIRGNIDAIILRHLYDGDNYGYEIIKSVGKNSQGRYELKEPSLYTSLRRLESQKLIASYWGTESRGGRRKYYSITPAGAEAYREHLAAWKTAKEIIDRLIERPEERT